MKWKKFTLTTTTEAVDLVSSMLDDVGLLQKKRQKECLLISFQSFRRMKALQR